MFKEKLKRIKYDGPGAAAFNKWVDLVMTQVEAARNLSAGGIATVTTEPGGANIYVPPFPIQVAVTTSAITARSGATAGSGTANFKQFNPPTFSDDPSRTNQTIYNFSSAAGGVATGKYVMLMKWYNEWFIIAAEC